MSETKQLLSWRAYYPHQCIADAISGPVQAETVAEAMKLLDTRNISNIQVMENGAWVWAV
jgi:hypothetical protein